eukprot:jgi/Chrzof1/14675/Cz09g11200.t1
MKSIQRLFWVGFEQHAATSRNTRGSKEGAAKYYNVVFVSSKTALCHPREWTASQQTVHFCQLLQLVIPAYMPKMLSVYV